MQFGFSQDLPGLVSGHHGSFTEKEAWEDYNKSLDGVKIYVPSRLATTSVTARYREWWLKSVSKFLGSEESNETFNASNTVADDDDDEGFAAKRRRCRTRRVKKCKLCDCGELASTEVPLSELFQKELGKRTREHKRRKRGREDDDDEDTSISIAHLIKCSKKTGGDEAESAGKGSRFEDDDENDSGICQKLASGDDETVAPEEIIKSEENDEEETEKITVLIPEKNFEDLLVDSNGGINDIVVSPIEARQTCDINGDSAEEKKKTMVDEGTKEAECLVAHEDGEKQRGNEIVDDDCDERLKQRKIAINEIASNLEARIMKVEKTLATIRKWKTRGNQIQTGVSA
ncbi:unnamed protein product [Microthlaspi erraticum]|uniref:Aminotransferase-like plant mobile domain-containing protein n=1 Tax=Microthlaspi erraticum TaxID=1685480 RepID=A0A6D2JX78_9BRAS|nr:unnamed protein product [Microthlaspi erraticum]